MFATTSSHEPHTTGFSGSAEGACYSPLHVFHHGPAWGPELGEPMRCRLQARRPHRRARSVVPRSWVGASLYELGCNPANALHSYFLLTKPNVCYEIPHNLYEIMKKMGLLDWM